MTIMIFLQNLWLFFFPDCAIHLKSARRAAKWRCEKTAHRWPPSPVAKFLSPVWACSLPFPDAFSIYPLPLPAWPAGLKVQPAFGRRNRFAGAAHPGPFKLPAILDMSEQAFRNAIFGFFSCRNMFTNALPSTTPSEYGATHLTCSGVEMPNPTTNGFLVLVRMDIKKSFKPA